MAKDETKEDKVPKLSDKDRQAKLDEHQRLTNQGAGLDARDVLQEVKQHDSQHNVKDETTLYNQSGVDQQNQRDEKGK